MMSGMYFFSKCVRESVKCPETLIHKGLKDPFDRLDRLNPIFIYIISKKYMSFYTFSEKNPSKWEKVCQVCQNH